MASNLVRVTDGPAQVPYDEYFLERARTQWLFGDWKSLAQISLDTIRHHPDRASLALFCAAGLLQIGKTAEAQHYLDCAKDWGVGLQSIRRVLIAGVHNNLGRAAAVGNQLGWAQRHFERAVIVGTPGADPRLAAPARTEEQLIQLGWLVSPLLRTKLGEVSRFSRSAGGVPAQTEPPSEIKPQLIANIHARKSNPYGHNRELTPALRATLLEFADTVLGAKELKPAYIDYLATKAIQLEKNCVGRLATTVQDAVARQLVAECVVTQDRYVILEIGALYGISLAILYNHLITRYPSVQVVCLDPFDGYYGKAIDAVLNQPVNDLTFLRNMRLANVPERDHQVIKRYSTDPEAIQAAEHFGIDLLIIDGDHSYDGVKFDFEHYFPYLKPGGYVIHDDYNAKEWPGVQQFVDEDLPRFKNYEHLGSISQPQWDESEATPMTRLSSLHNRHLGESCVLVCNGPSLNEMDLSFLKRQVCIGLNKIYLGIQRFKFYPRYYVAVNQKVIEQSLPQIKKLNAVKFIGSRGHRLIPEDALTYHLNTSSPAARFSEDLSFGAHEGWTVTHVALQVAYFLGFREVVIIGMDHRYAYSGAPNETAQLSGPDPNHFSPDYFSGQSWDNPDLAQSEESYRQARAVFEAEGRRILDATINGACRVFQKVDYRAHFGIAA